MLVSDINDHVQNITAILESPHEKGAEPSNLIDLGMEFLETVKELTCLVEQKEDLTLEEFFMKVGNSLEYLWYVIWSNETNLFNKALVNHLKNLTNKFLVESRVIDVVNAYMTQYSFIEEFEELGV